MLRLCVCLQVFFNPEIYSNDFTTSLPTVIDKCIQSAPIDTRRALYKVRKHSVWLRVLRFCFFFLIKTLNNQGERRESNSRLHGLNVGF